jgi:acyl carrier protein
MKTDTTIRTSIGFHIGQIAKEQDRKLAPIVDDLPLIDLGLDSLSIAMLVARLEDEFGFDPFNTGETLEFPLTVGDFIRVYESFPR